MWYILLIIFIGPVSHAEKAEVVFGEFKNLEECAFVRDFLTYPMFNKSPNLGKVTIYCKKAIKEKKA